MSKSKSSIVIITAPSGTGKTTLTRRLVSEVPTLSFSVSMTTRPIRTGEKNGEHYWFVDRENFLRQVDQGRLAEWADVFGNLYGTTKDEIARILKLGHQALLEIDVQGAKNIRAQYPDACAIFIMPPSIQDLWERLRKRGTDSLTVCKRRLKTAGEELKEGKNFQHFIINDKLDRAFSELKNLVRDGQAVSLTYEQGLHHCNALIDEFNQIDWLSDDLALNKGKNTRKHE